MSNSVDLKRSDRCSICGVTLYGDTRTCPNCGAPIAEKKPKSIAARILSWRHFRHLLIVAILLLLPHVPQVSKVLPFRVLLRTSPLVLEAVTRANAHPETEALLGRPINSGWLARGYVWSDETGWSEGKIWIPVSGAKGAGTLYARVGQAHGPWVFSELRLIRDDGRALDLLAPIAQPSLVPLPTNVRVFIVPLGRAQGLGLDKLPDFYRERYGLFVELLEPIPLEPETLNTERGQLIFEELVELMRHRLPHLASDKSAFLIGVTDEDMYMRDWNFAYTAYAPGDRAGVISSHRFVPYPLAGKESLLRTRVRKMITRTIGFVVFKLPRSDDPSSVMFRDLYGWASADLMSDSLEGLGARAVIDEFVTAHGMPPSSAELLSSASNFDYSKVDGYYPCVRIKKPANTPTPFLEAATAKCVQGVFLDRDLDEVEVDLRVGTLITRTADLFVSSKVPLAATRCYRSWDNLSRTFGRNTTLSWDLFPTGSRQPYTYVEITTCDGQQLRFERISKGTGYADAVYEHRATSTPFLGSRFTWNGSGWDLKLRDGSLYRFPESYYAKKPVDGALIGFRDANGQAVKIERRERRNLKRIIAPDQHSITFEHDPSDRIIKAEDDQKRKVEYLYDHGGRLVEVRGLRSMVRFKYEGTYLMEIGENGRRKIEFDYDDKGRIRRLTLMDGRSYRIRYDYDPKDDERIVRAFVTSPDGSVAKFDIPRNCNLC